MSVTIRPECRELVPEPESGSLYWSVAEEVFYARLIRRAGCTCPAWVRRALRAYAVQLAERHCRMYPPLEPGIVDRLARYAQR